MPDQLFHGQGSSRAGHRVNVVPSARRVRVTLDGDVLADSRRARLIFETGLPTRYYLPREDVRAELLGPTATQTRCPFKGLASYWSVRVGDRLHADVAWSYPDPIPEVADLRNLIAFYDDRVEITVDGQRAGSMQGAD